MPALSLSKCCWCASQKESGRRRGKRRLACTEPVEVLVYFLEFVAHKLWQTLVCLRPRHHTPQALRELGLGGGAVAFPELVRNRLERRTVLAFGAVAQAQIDVQPAQKQRGLGKQGLQCLTCRRPSVGENGFWAVICFHRLRLALEHAVGFGQRGFVGIGGDRCAENAAPAAHRGDASTGSAQV